MNTAREVAALLAGYRFTFASEAELQEGIALALTLERVVFEREATIPKGGGRVDFLVERVAVEIKVAGTAFEVAEQLARYLRAPNVDEALLVTTKRAHLAVPRDLGGKPVVVHLLAGGVA